MRTTGEKRVLASMGERAREVQILLGRRPEALDVVDEAVALLARKEDLATQRRAQLLVGEGAMLP